MNYIFFLASNHKTRWNIKYLFQDQIRFIQHIIHVLPYIKKKDSCTRQTQNGYLHFNLQKLNQNNISSNFELIWTVRINMRHVQRQICVYVSGQRGVESNFCVDVEEWNQIIDESTSTLVNCEFWGICFIEVDFHSQL